jgi:hypothetical protein
MTSISKYIYVAGCVFTRDHPELSVKVQDYLARRWDMPIARCCVPQYRLEEFIRAMPGWLQTRWSNTPDYFEPAPEQILVSVCHNCAAIFEETKPKVKRLSLWELLLQDEDFPFPDFAGERMTLQDCWRSHDNAVEQEAVRTLMRKMNISIVELEANREKTQFCGESLYMPAPLRNLKLAPKRFVENAQGKFLPHSDEERIAIMREHCRTIRTDKVVAYCHYCVKGLNMGGKQGLENSPIKCNKKRQQSNPGV